MASGSLFLGIDSSQELIPTVWKFLCDTLRKRECTCTTVVETSILCTCTTVDETSILCTCTTVDETSSPASKLRFHGQWATLFHTRFLFGSNPVPGPKGRFYNTVGPQSKSQPPILNSAVSTLVRKHRDSHFRAVFRIRIRWNQMFLDLLDPDPDPLVRGMDPDTDPALDPDPSIIKQI